MVRGQRVATRVFVSFAALAITLAGCGGGDDSDPGSADESAVAACRQLGEIFTFIEDRDVRLETALRDYDLKQAVAKRLERITAADSDMAKALAPALDLANDVTVRARAIRAARAICSGPSSDAR